MITQQDLESAIAECQGQRNPSASTCLKLAAFYTIKREMFGRENEETPRYSFLPAPEESEEQSEFLSAVKGKDTAGVLAIMDELMDSMQVLQPRIYESVMRKLERL